MAIIYLKHPKHGTHIIYSTSEIPLLEKNGWKVHCEAPAEPSPVRKGRPKQHEEAPKDAA